MARITTLGSENGTAYGVRFVICRNAEVIGLATVGPDPTGNGWRQEAAQAGSAAAAAIDRLGFDYDYESSFKAYNGGPRKMIVEAVFYSADVDDDGEVGEWATCDEADVPASYRGAVAAAGDAAYAALSEVMEAAVDSWLADGDQADADKA